MVRTPTDAEIRFSDTAKNATATAAPKRFVEYRATPRSQKWVRYSQLRYSASQANQLAMKNNWADYRLVSPEVTRP
jgi:hypothetical protein